MAIRVDPRLPTPPSRQLVEAILERIAGGEWGPGDRLPSVRGLAAEALVNPNTVGKAYRELEALGAVKGRNGAGMFVTPEGPKTAKADRRAATLRALEDAVARALRVGHDAQTLRGRVDKWINGSAIGSGKSGTSRNGAA
ncbi:MAG: GntR family transcriptional regulator [bacterium]|nr:GntR family transcriptional regulator [bacterium]